MDYNNYNLGKYIMLAFNNPKKYPKKPFLYEEPAPRIMTGEEMERIVKRNNIILGGQTQNKNNGTHS